VVSGQVTRKRRDDLLAAGATDVIHKDDVDSVRLGEALLRVFKWQPETTIETSIPVSSKLVRSKKLSKIKDVKS
jgi:hypothetical protein